MLFIKSISMLYYNIYIIILLVFSDFVKKKGLNSIILYKASLFSGTALTLRIHCHAAAKNQHQSVTNLVDMLSYAWFIELQLLIHMY